METRITSIQAVDGLGTTPARVNRSTGQMFVNRGMWNKLKPEHRFFVALHEAAHATLQTKDEEAADRWAFRQYASAGYPLSEGVLALTQILNGKRPEHKARMERVLHQAVAYDAANGNVTADGLMMIMPMGRFDGDEYSDFSKKWRSKLRKAGGIFLTATAVAAGVAATVLSGGAAAPLAIGLVGAAGTAAGMGASALNASDQKIVAKEQAEKQNTEMGKAQIAAIDQKKKTTNIVILVIFGIILLVVFIKLTRK
jgi:hypothetical protein